MKEKLLNNYFILNPMEIEIKAKYQDKEELKSNLQKRESNFYAKKSEEFKKYKFKDKSKLIKGEKPDFFNFLKKYFNKEFKILDLGCGSGEFTLSLSPYFKEIIGIDAFEEYIKTANQNNNKKNVKFIISDAKKLPFKDNSFDIVISARGPLSAKDEFMKESLRVLKKGGLLVEETIGEKDKLGLKKLFERGQNYPVKQTKLKDVKQKLKKFNLTLLEANCYFYLKEYRSITDVLKLLKRAPIIPDFDENKDKNKIEILKEELIHNKKVNLSFHRLQWVAKKPF